MSCTQSYSCYIRGCRNPECRAACAAYRRRKRAARRAEQDSSEVRRFAEQVAAMAGWIDRAACKGSDPALWHPERGEPTVEARLVCARCPVSDECLDHALALPERIGMWGGLSARERRRVRRGLRGKKLTARAARAWLAAHPAARSDAA